MAATTVQLTQGTYRGTEKDGVHSFHDVPYAAGHERFQSPKRIGQSDDEYDATEFGCNAPQNPSRLANVMGPMPTASGPQNEVNCGVLSVYRPADTVNDSPLPVIVWIHGGAFVSGGSQTPWYDGSRLAKDGRVIVVCINYRLGVFGYLYDEGRSLSSDKLPIGNEDVIAAFEWIQDNISHFNGDPKRVTAYGQSAGGYHIQTLLDRRPDLFARAILQSSPAGRIVTAQDAKAFRQTVTEQLPEGKTLDTASTEELLAAQGKAMRIHSGHLAIMAPYSNDATTPGGRVPRPDLPRKQILIGWQKDDASCFAALGLAGANLPPWMLGTTAYQLAPPLTKNLFSDPSKALARRLQDQGHLVTMYTLECEPEGFDLGATHCSEIPLVFGDEEAWKVAPMLGTVGWAEWERRGKILRQIWGRFARDGTPPGPGGLEDMVVFG